MTTITEPCVAIFFGDRSIGIAHRTSSHWCCSISLATSSSVSTSTSSRCQDRSGHILGDSMHRQNSLTRTQAEDNPK